jgi:hypothetical protein
MIRKNETCSAINTQTTRSVLADTYALGVAGVGVSKSQGVFFFSRSQVSWGRSVWSPESVAAGFVSAGGLRKRNVASPKGTVRQTDTKG